jgi:regulator of protease activity HflC (stomatin/prohibitin superfamily)
LLKLLSKMKKISRLLLLLVASIALFASCSRVDSGYVGVKVYLLGNEKGVNNEVLGVGRYWIGFNESLYTFPTYQVNYVYTKDATEGSANNEEFTFQTKEGMECSMDMGLAMHFNPDEISTMFQTYHKGEEEIRGIVVRNTLRSALNKVASGMPVEFVYGEGKSTLIDSVTNLAIRELSGTGIEIDKLYLIGSIRIPQSVIDALNAKIQMTQEAQKSENALRKADADAKIIVVNAKAQAEANRILSASITQNLIDWKAVDRWNGILPTTTGGVVPFLNIK